MWLSFMYVCMWRVHNKGVLKVKLFAGMLENVPIKYNGIKLEKFSGKLKKCLIFSENENGALL